MFLSLCELFKPRTLTLHMCKHTESICLSTLTVISCFLCHAVCSLKHRLWNVALGSVRVHTQICAHIHSVYGTLLLLQKQHDTLCTPIICVTVCTPVKLEYVCVQITDRVKKSLNQAVTNPMALRFPPPFMSFLPFSGLFQQCASCTSCALLLNLLF